METLFPIPERQFAPLNPETIKGCEYLMPSVVGRNMYGEFKLANAHLPLNWHDKINNISNFSPHAFTDYLNHIANDMGINNPKNQCPVNIFVDKQKMLREVTIDRGRALNPRLIFDDNLLLQKGEYNFKNVIQTDEAVVFLAAISRFLWAIDREHIYPSVNGQLGALGPFELTIPKEIRNKVNMYSRSENQLKYLIKANNIVGKFGLNECILEFDKNGFINYAEVLPGENGAYFSRGKLGSENVDFHSHNIDYCDQFLGLFAVVTEQINELLNVQRLYKK